MTENKWSTKLCTEMRKMNAIAFRVVGNFRQASGWPDCTVIHASEVFFIEFKGEKTLITALQQSTIADINKKGGFAVVVRQPDQITNEEGRLWATFDGTGQSLIQSLHFIKDGK